MDINYELYKVFYHVGKHLSFSEAARSLFISQSAVSQSIKNLEEMLNQELFYRSTKKVSFTPQGELLFKHIEPAINLINRGELILGEDSTNSGQLRIGASDTICRYFLVPFLKDFHEKYPNIHIKVTNGTSIQCANLLERNKVDLIVTNSPNISLNDMMQIVPVKEFNDVFIANSNFYPIGKEAISLNKLQDYPILMLDGQSTTSAFLHNLFLDHSLDLVPSIELSSNDLLIDLARIGLGVAFIPDFSIDDFGGLSEISIKENVPSRTLVAAYKKDVPLSYGSKYFLETMMKMKE